MSRFRMFLLAGIAAVVVAGCDGSPAELPQMDDAVKSGVGTPEVVAGEGALRLYGIPSEPKPEPTPTVLDPSWFPRKAWASASVLPYDNGAPIRILPVYSDPGLDVSGTWLGDLEEGAEVLLLAVDQTGRACFVSGQAIQGWELEGWAACNRILLSEPTAVP